MRRGGAEGESVGGQYAVGSDVVTENLADTAYMGQNGGGEGPGGWQMRRTKGSSVHSGRKLPYVDLSERPEGPQGGDIDETASWLKDIQPMRVGRRGNGGGRNGRNSRRGR